MKNTCFRSMNEEGTQAIHPVCRRGSFTENDAIDCSTLLPHLGLVGAGQTPADLAARDEDLVQFTLHTRGS